MEKYKRTSKIFIFILIGILVFSLIQEILTPNGLDDGGNTEQRVNGIKHLEKNSLDVLFFGSSLVYNGVSPILLYEKNNILAYSLASSGQPIEISYYLLENIFKRQTPNIVMLEASALMENKTESKIAKNSYWRYVLDAIPMSMLKINLAKEYNDKDFGDGGLSILFPIIKYHSRWNELNAQDFSNLKDNFMFSAGETVKSSINPSIITREQIDYWATKLKDLESYRIIGQENGNDFSDFMKDEAMQYKPVISENSLKYISKMNELCKVHGTNLILFKIPDASYLHERPQTWTKEKNEMVQKFAQENEIPYLDLVYAVDCGIDFTQDTVDNGKHLNIRGANKVTEKISEFLSQNYNIDEKSDVLYDEAIKSYEKVKKYAYMESEIDFQSYIKNLAKNIESITIIISACSDYTSSLSDEDYALLQNLNLNYIDKGKYMDSYVAIISEGTTTYEAVSAQKITKEIEICGHKIIVSSSGWLSGHTSQIKVDGKEFGMGYEGLNFVIIDNETGVVIDSCNYNTIYENKECYRNNTVICNMLEEYKGEIELK